MQAKVPLRKHKANNRVVQNGKNKRLAKKYAPK